MHLKRSHLPVLVVVLVVILTACSQSETASTPGPEGNSSLTVQSDSLALVLNEIAETMEQVRGLELLDEVDRNFMTRSELQIFLMDRLEEEDLEEILVSQEVLSILGLIPQDTDLYQLYLDLFTEQIAGLYDQDTEKLYIVVEEGTFGPDDKTTLAHEYVHALQQQHFDLRSLTEAVEDNSEAAAALTALVEGDAYLQTDRYRFNFLSTEELDLLFETGPDDSPVFDAAPYVIQKSLSYDFEVGVDFAVALVNSGGLDAIDDAFSDLPVSTEQVLHPEKYFSHEEPISVILPDVAGALGTGWSEVRTDFFGEFSLRTYLETAIDKGAAAQAAAGWGGDRLALLKGPQDQRVFVSLIAWDSRQDAQEFYDVALAPLSEIPDEPFVGIQGNEVLLVIASSSDLVDRVRQQFAGF